MSNRPDDDLFGDSKMSFGQHLEELRVVLFRSLIGVGLCSLLGLLVAAWVVDWLQGPLRTALQEFYLKKAKMDLEKEYDGPVPPEMLLMIETQRVVPERLSLDVPGLLGRMKKRYPDLEVPSLSRFQYQAAQVPSERLVAATTRLLGEDSSLSEQQQQAAKALRESLTSAEQDLLSEWGKADSLSDEQLQSGLQLLNQIVRESKLAELDGFSAIVDGDETLKALHEAASNDEEHQRIRRHLLHRVLDLPLPEIRLVEVPFWKSIEVRVQALNAQEGFLIWLKAAFITGLVIASPWVFYQVWSFVGVGLYPHERRYVYIYLPLSLVLFLAGAAMAFFLVFRYVLDFLFQFNMALNINPDPRISEWLGFVLLMPIGFGVAFQLPLVMLFLNRLRIISIDAYRENWRIAILVIFVVSMILTPADPVSMLLMALPLCALYFMGIGMCLWMPKGRNPFDDQVAEDSPAGQNGGPQSDGSTTAGPGEGTS